MDKKEFKKITASLFREYGFNVEGKYYYLDLDEVSLIAVMLPRYGSYVLSYNFSLHAIHSSDQRVKGDPFVAYDSRLIDTIDKKGSKFIDPLNLKQEEYIKDITERLHRYFHPFKVNPLKHILSNIPEVIGNAPDVIVFCKEARKFFGLLE